MAQTTRLTQSGIRPDRLRKEPSLEFSARHSLWKPLQMAEERIQRRLAAILAADVVGYSRLMEQNEAETLAALKQRRREILQPLVAEHRGRIVKVMGDGVLTEFTSAVNAVACAVELQRKMTVANDALP